MRSIKMLGLAALAAMVAMAFVGASSAAAAPEHPEIVLCKVKQLTCNELKNWAGVAIPESEPPTHKVEIHGEIKVGEALLLTSLGTLHCEESLAIVTLLNRLASLVKGHLLELNFKKCYRLKLFGGKEECTVTVNEKGDLSLTPAETKLLAIAESVKSEEEKITKATVVCGTLINCKYEASPETKLIVHSDPELGHLLLLAVDTPLKGVGGEGEGLCPETSKWDATYHAVTLEEGLPLQLNLWIEL